MVCLVGSREKRVQGSSSRLKGEGRGLPGAAAAFLSLEGGQPTLVSKGRALGFFVVCSLKLCKTLEVHLYINLCTCCSRKYCNNYCRDCFL
jgi:hypothetical protein